ncbi:hypothetical protein D3C78_1894540 [compost metagenome]
MFEFIAVGVFDQQLLRGKGFTGVRVQRGDVGGPGGQYGTKGVVLGFQARYFDSTLGQGSRQAIDECAGLFLVQ